MELLKDIKKYKSVIHEAREELMSVLRNYYKTDLYMDEYGIWFVRDKSAGSKRKSGKNN